VNEINIKAMIRLRHTIAIFSSFLHTHKYPAFTDREHLNEVTPALGGRVSGDPMTVDGEKIYDSKPEAPFGNKDIAVKKMAYMTIDYTKDTTFKGIDPWLDFSVDYEKIPNAEGLWLPYISALANHDTDKVPDVIEKYFLRTLGETLEDCILEMREMRGEWGMIGKTDSGKEISHFAAALDLAISGQARVVPCFRLGRYVGSILSGGGYSIDVCEKSYRPVDHGDLVKAIKGSDMHTLALASMSRLMGSEVLRKEFNTAATSMLSLRNFMIDTWAQEKNKGELLRHAAYLMFPDSKPWAINESTIANAFEKITDPNFTLKTALPRDFPVHYSMIFEMDTLSVVWSCFGGMAPTFRIPGGHQFDLKEEMVFDQKAKDGKITKRNLVRIAVRNVILPKAIADLKIVQSEKTILNPLSAPKVRASAQNQDRIFTEERGKLLMAALRQFCGIQLDKKGKKRAREDDDGEEPAHKRGKKKDAEGW